MEENLSTIELEFTDEDFIQLARLAHERDITFNKMVELLLMNAIEEERSKQEEPE